MSATLPDQATVEADCKGGKLMWTEKTYHEKQAAARKQEGGSHYKDMAIQPYEYCHRNKLGHLESNVVKYVSRWRDKGGLEDIRKAIHTLEYLIELEIANNNDT
jgi:Protein of unknwon function (DUF3310)